MQQAEAKLIIPRRNFLVRALGFTAAGAAMSIPIVTAESAQSRVDYHTKELEKAFRDLHAGLGVVVRGNEHSRQQVIETDSAATIIFYATNKKYHPITGVEIGRYVTA